MVERSLPPRRYYSGFMVTWDENSGVSIHSMQHSVEGFEKSLMRNTYEQYPVWEIQGLIRACAFLAKTPNSYGFNHLAV